MAYVVTAVLVVISLILVGVVNSLIRRKAGPTSVFTASGVRLLAAFGVGIIVFAIAQVLLVGNLGWFALILALALFLLAYMKARKSRRTD